MTNNKPMNTNKDNQASTEAGDGTSNVGSKNGVGRNDHKVPVLTRHESTAGIPEGERQSTGSPSGSLGLSSDSGDTRSALLKTGNKKA